MDQLVGLSVSKNNLKAKPLHFADDTNTCTWNKLLAWQKCQCEYTHKSSKFVRLENIPDGKKLILLCCKYLQT